jgi:hypothetical protein
MLFSALPHRPERKEDAGQVAGAWAGQRVERKSLFLKA